MIWDRIKVCCRHSFLGKLTEINEGGWIKIVKNSGFLACPGNFFYNRKKRISYHRENSKILFFSNAFKNEFLLLPLKIFSIIIFAAITINTMFSFLFFKKIWASGWIMRACLLYLALYGILYSHHWDKIKSSSIFLKILKGGKIRKIHIS